MKKDIVKIKFCKKVETRNQQGNKNGWLLEVVSDRDKFTKHIRGQIYLTVAEPREFKGYHLHAVSDYFVTCLKGKTKEIIYKSRTKKQEVRMGDGDFKTVFLPKGYPHAIQNIGKEAAYVLVYRYPAWDPKMDEQLDIPKKEINTIAAWKKIRKFLLNFN